MADETPEDRLEAALERIARIVDSRSGEVDAQPRRVVYGIEALQAAAVTEFSDRLDRIIDTLREALGK